jgi:hypothetical protein
MNRTAIKTYEQPAIEAVIVTRKPAVRPSGPAPEAIRIYGGLECDPLTPYIHVDRRAELADTFPFKRKGFRRHQR